MLKGYRRNYVFELSDVISAAVLVLIVRGKQFNTIIIIIMFSMVTEKKALPRTIIPT